MILATGKGLAYSHFYPFPTRGRYYFTDSTGQVKRKLCV